MKTVSGIFLFVGLLGLASSTANAQTIRKRFTSDLLFGFNLASMDIKGANMYKEPKVGFAIGANINYKILHNIQLQSGLYVTKRGLRQHIERSRYDSGVDVEYYGDTLRNTAADYLQVPLCLGYEVYLSKKVAVNLNAGGYVAYGFKGKNRGEAYATTIKNGVEQSTAITIPSYEEETFALKKWNRLDYGVLGRFGLIYDIYTVNVTYEYGLYNVADDGRDLRNRTVSVTLGFRF
ncbi:MAG: PorT family protein [Prevotella sp.]|jgi:hypothetical protein|nr:PorT family protein [Prevotella sp.]